MKTRDLQEWNTMADCFNRQLLTNSQSTEN